MSVSEKERLALYEQLSETLGSSHAGTLMEYLPPKTWGEFATKDDIRLLEGQLRAEMTGLRGEMQSGFAAMDLRFAQQTRTMMWAMAGFALTVWISLLVAGIA